MIFAPVTRLQVFPKILIPTIQKSLCTVRRVQGPPEVCVRYGLLENDTIVKRNVFQHKFDKFELREVP